jgi:hypothetical protein
MAMSLSERLNKKRLLIWAVLVPLAICLVYSIFYIANTLGFSLLAFSNRGIVEQSSIFSSSLDIAVWGISVFLILARLGYDLESNTVKGYYRSYAGVGLLVIICSLAVGVCATILGLVGTVALVPISILLLSMCVVFSSDFFGVYRLPFTLRLLIGGLIIGSLIELASFLV